MKSRSPKRMTKWDWWAIIVLALLWYVFAVYDAKAFGNYDAKYISNYDADSITLKVWLWPSTSQATGLYAIENMRLYGVDTPEKGWRAKCLKELKLSDKAEQYVRDMLMGKKHLLIDVQPIRGARGRPLITIWLDVGKDDLVSLADLLIENKYARPYFGKGKRQSWCGKPILLPKGTNIETI